MGRHTVIRIIKQANIRVNWTQIGHNSGNGSVLWLLDRKHRIDRNPPEFYFDLPLMHRKDKRLWVEIGLLDFHAKRAFPLQLGIK
jgi:hypothetical protein